MDRASRGLQMTTRNLPIGLALLCAGQALFVLDRARFGAIVLWLAGITFVVSSNPDKAAPAEARSRWSADFGPRTSWTSRRTQVPGVIAVVAAGILWWWQRSASDKVLVGVLLWLTSMGCATAALWQPGHRNRAPDKDMTSSWWQRSQEELFIATGLALLAVGLRLFHLSSYPSTLNGDEAAFGIYARRVLAGQISDPFGVGYLSHPLMWDFVQAASMGLVGDGVVGLRLPSALAGGAAVALVYLLIRRVTGRIGPSLIGATLLATLHLHMYWSRSALPNGWTASWALLVLYLLGEAMASRRPAGLFVVGVVTGLAQYFYFANRVLVVVVVGVVLVDALSEFRIARNVGAVARGGLARLSVVLFGFALAVLPQVAYYSVHPGDFDSRSRSVSIFASGWLQRESDRTGRHPLTILGEQFVDVALMPFRGDLTGQLRGGPPYVGWLLALMGAVGLGLVMVRVGKGPIWAGLALVYWTSVAGISTTVEPATSARWVNVVVVLSVMGALGLDLVAQGAATYRFVSPRRVAACVGAIVLASTSWNLHRYFHDPNQVEVYGDTNTEVVDHLARSLVSIDAGATVYFSGAPRIWFNGFKNFEFRAPNVTGIDIEEPLTDADEPPTLDGMTLFVFLPERIADLTAVQDWYPGGDQNVVIDANGDELYTSYTTGP